MIIKGICSKAQLFKETSRVGRKDHESYFLLIFIEIRGIKLVFSNSVRKYFITKYAIFVYFFGATTGGI